MTAARLTASDVILRIVSVAMMLNGIAAFVCGIAMFWGSLREVLGAPLIMTIGVLAYIAARALWWTVEEDRRARA